MRRALLITSAALAWASVAHTAAAATGPVTPFCTTQKALVDQYVGPMVRPPSANSAATTDPKTVGAVVVTLKLGDAPCTFAFGETAIGSGIAPDGQTIFELASVTKTFTTAILALRAAAGLVNVHLPVTLLLPPEYELSPRMQRVSLQQLATFSGGFPWSDPAGFTRSWPQRRFVQEVNALEPTDPIPGEADLPTVNYYSNGSIGFLGQILMNVDRMVGLGDYQPRQRGFTVWMEDNLTGPLAMPSTKVNPQGAWATGYAIANGQYHATLPFLWVPWGAAGALRSNAADMTNFLRANICAHHATDPACAGLPPDLLAALPLAHAPNDYIPHGTLADPTLYTVDTQTGKPSENVQAWAWVYVPPPDPNPDNASAIVWKDGGHPGFSTWIGFNPGKAYGIVLLYNTGGVSPKDAGLEIIRQTP